MAAPTTFRTCSLSTRACFPVRAPGTLHRSPSRRSPSALPSTLRALHAAGSSSQLPGGQIQTVERVYGFVEAPRIPHQNLPTFRAWVDWHAECWLKPACALGASSSPVTWEGRNDCLRQAQDDGSLGPGPRGSRDGDRVGSGGCDYREDR